MKLRFSLLFFIFILVLSGCTRSAPPAVTLPPAQPQSTTQILILPTVTAMTLRPTAAPTVEPTPAPFEPFDITSSVDSLNVRTGPGYLFPALRMVNEGDSMTVYGVSPGGGWVYVETASGEKGWVFRKLIVSGADFRPVPQVEPGSVILVSGRVTNTQGNPIQGVQFAIEQGGSRTDADTDETGVFYAYLPADSSGSWNVSYVAIACDSNVWADNTCTNYKPGYAGTPDPEAVTISLPISEPLSFTWK